MCERSLGSVRRERLDHLLVLGARQLRRVLREYVAFVNRARPHRGLGRALPAPSPGEMEGRAGPLRAGPLLGGLHHRLPGPPARMRFPARRAALDPYLPYLERRWAGGCRNGKRLWREIRARGFAHAYSGVARFVAQLRRAERARQPVATTRRAATRPPTPRQVAMRCLRRPEQRTPAQQAYLDQLRRVDAAIATADTLTQDFATMLRERGGERLDAWLAEAEACPVPALRRFATGLAARPPIIRRGVVAFSRARSITRHPTVPGLALHPGLSRRCRHRHCTIRKIVCWSAA